MRERSEITAHDERPDDFATPPQSLARIVLRPMASVLPLGWFAFSAGLVLVGVIELGWVEDGPTRFMPVLLLSFVAPLEIVAAVGALLERDTANATGLALFAAAWVATGVIGLRQPIGEPIAALGVLLVVFTAAVAVLGAVAYEGTPLVAALLFLAAIRTALSAVHHLSGSDAMLGAAGAIALVVAAAGFYGGVAFLLEDMHGRTVVPVGRRNTSRRSIHDGVTTQLENVGREAGVRRRL